MSHDTSRSWEWHPNTPTLVTWNVIGLGLVVVGVIAFTGLYAVTHGGDASFTFSGGGALWAMLVTLLLVAVLMVLHEWIHGLAMQRFGARPA